MSIFHTFDSIGKDLFNQSLNNSHSGNMSIRRANKILITASGSMLHRLSPSDLIELSINSKMDASLDNPSSRAYFSNIKAPSIETVVHKSIYLKTDADAVVHAHSPFTVTIAQNSDSIIPFDAEGAYYFQEIPVVTARTTIGSEDIAELVPEIMLKNRIPLVVVRGHGVFSCGRNLVEAYKWISSLENSSRLLLLKNMYRDL